MVYFHQNIHYITYTRAKSIFISLHAEIPPFVSFFLDLVIQGVVYGLLAPKERHSIDRTVLANSAPLSRSVANTTAQLFFFLIILEHWDKQNISAVYALLNEFV